MIKIRYSSDRGQGHLDWLDSRHSFSFGQYYDPNHISFATLRVINEDRIQPRGGFKTHSHQDMEIITYVLSGTLQHKDSLGNGSVIRPGEVQRMSAGTGISHSEFNGSETEPVHLLQIWIFPNQQGLTPSYEQKAFPEAEQWGKLQLLGSSNGRHGSVTIHQDVELYGSRLKAQDQINYTLKPGRVAWLQIARGSVVLEDNNLVAGDGVAIDFTNTSQNSIKLIGTSEPAEILLFDLAVPQPSNN